jgi:3-polyprenyl-4-hydroxybenzoate decarboxylase
MNKLKPVILTIAAASGVIYGVRTLECLLKSDFNVELIISEKAYFIFKQ